MFAPVGHYRGLRPQWQRLCGQKQEKSWIQNYRDYRFNGPFEVVAQVFHNHQDFLQLLESHTTGHNKQTNTMKSLSDPDVILLLECLGLFFHPVTDLYWNMVISPKTSHPEFKSIVSKLKDCLQNCLADPQDLISSDSFSCLRKFPATSPATQEKMSKAVKN